MYKELDRCLKEQFIYGLNDDGMIVEIIHELTLCSDMSSVTSEQVLVWVKIVEAQRDQKTTYTFFKVNKDFDLIKSH